jgi:hypothetical protein
MRYTTYLLTIAFFLAFSTLYAHNGSINGQVTEENGLELTGATVQLDPGALHTTTNELGFFNFPNLTAGTYTVTVQFLGFETSITKEVQVRDSETSTLRIEMLTAPLDLRTVEISNTHVARGLQTVSTLDIQTRPVNTAQDVLRMVPGLFIAQHAGGGKAEQLFLRGFDIDHGTDVNLTVDGMPVNMVSHAHGQGYADLHFVIPELIGTVAYKKGPYDADAGNFTTAGRVSFKTVDALDQSIVKFEAGQFNSLRALGAFNLLTNTAARKNQHAYLAAETVYSDGYFESPQAFRRLNLLGKYSALLDDDHRISFSASAFQSNWNASGQIPERAVKSGEITPFGAIDNTEGGITSRYNFNFEHTKGLKNNGLLRNQVFYINYNFELFSNFTFFLNDPINGDQIRQKEKRNIFGYNGTYQSEHQLFGQSLQSEIGVFLRADQTDKSELSRTKNRSYTTQALALGDVTETNTGAYVSETIEITDKLTFNAALRADVFQFQYENALDSAYNPQSITSAVFSPKANLYYDFTPKFRLYASGGYGFHSNDTRVVVPQNGLKTLPKATGLDLGAIIQPTPSLFVQVAAWYLALQQEFVYVGDEGVVEPGGRTRRQGLDLTARLQIARHFYTDVDFTYAHARAIDEPEGGQYIPLAPKFTGTGGIRYDRGKGLYGGLRFRYLGDRAANGDNSLIAKGYFIADAVGGWKNDQLEIGFSIQNLTDVSWKEAQFETESRLRNETEPVTEIHYTPGTPFFLKASLAYRF